MNKNYRVVLNRSTGNYIVASELARGKTKSALTSAICAALLSGLSASALAANGATVSGPDQHLELSNQALVGTGQNGYGLLIDNGASAKTTNVNISATGPGGDALYTHGAGSRAELQGGNISTNGGSTAYGLYAGAGTTINAADVTLNTTGASLYAAPNGIINGKNLNITASQDEAVYATGAGALINLDGGHITAQKTDAVRARNGSTINLANIAIESSTYGIDADEGTLNGKGLNILITGYGDAVRADGLNGMISIADSTVNTTGRNAFGINIVNGKGVSTNVDYTTHDDTAYGASVRGVTGSLDLHGGSVTTHGSQAYALVDSRGAKLNVDGVNVQSQSIGLYQTGANSHLNQANIANSTINVAGAAGKGIYTDEAASQITLKNSSVIANDGIALAMNSHSSLHLDADHALIAGKMLLQGDQRWHTRDAVINATNGSQLLGDVNINRNLTSDSQIHLSNGSTWSGASQGLNSLSLSDNSRWNITTSSDVNNLSISDSTLAFNSVNGQPVTLKVNGDYSGHNATIVFNSDRASSDALHITGNSSGSTNLVMANAGEKKVQSLQGQQLVQVDGNNSGEFVQQGRIVAGAYDYELVKDAQGYYLGSAAAPVAGQQVLRPEAASYVANLAAANTLFSTSMSDRLGETQYVDALGQPQVTSLWLRNIGGHSRFRDSSGQLNTDSNRYAVQLGGDLAQGTLSGDDRFHFGAMAGYGNVQSKSRSAISGYSSRGQINGYSAGLYASWLQDNAEHSGAYLDSWALYNWFNNSVKGDDIGQESYKSKGLTASLEGGYSFNVASFGDSASFWLRPQAQVTWMGVKAKNDTELNGTRVTGSGEDNLQTRAGLRAYFKVNKVAQDAGTVEPYVEANWLHNTKAFGASMNGVNVSQAGARNIGEVKLGLEAKVNQTVNLWGNIGQQVGDHSYSDTSAMVGVKVNF